MFFTLILKNQKDLHLNYPDWINIIVHNPKMVAVTRGISAKSLKSTALKVIFLVSPEGPLRRQRGHHWFLTGSVVLFIIQKC